MRKRNKSLAIAAALGASSVAFGQTQGLDIAAVLGSGISGVLALLIAGVLIFRWFFGGGGD